MTSRADQEICWFQILKNSSKETDEAWITLNVKSRVPYSMHDFVLMTEGHAVQQHSHITLDLRVCQRLIDVSNHFRQITQHIFHDKYVAHSMCKHVKKFDNLNRSDQEESQTSVCCSFILRTFSWSSISCNALISLKDRWWNNRSIDQWCSRTEWYCLEHLHQTRISCAGELVSTRRSRSSRKIRQSDIVAERPDRNTLHPHVCICRPF